MDYRRSSGPVKKRYREWDIECKVHVGNLGSSASKHELENAFGKYGPLRNVWVARNPPGFAFVLFEDKRDAEDSCRGLDGTRCCGTRIRVEMSSGRKRRDREREERGGRGRPVRSNRSRSPRRSRTRSRSVSPVVREKYRERDDYRERERNGGGERGGERERRSRSNSRGRRYQ